MPELPYINVTVFDNNVDLDEFLDELSGSIVKNKSNEIVGIISKIFTDSKIISIIPTVSICRFFDEYKKNDTFYGICNIIAKVKDCEIEINNNTQYGLQIDDNYDINYNKCVFDNSILKTTKIRGQNLRNNDVICEINNLKLNDENMVYCKAIGMNVPVSTYIALNYMIGDMIEFVIYRPSSNIKRIKIKARPIKTAKYLPILYDKKYIDYNGLIFIELSEELIELYVNNGYYFDKVVDEYMDKRPYRNSDEKIVVLIDIIRKKISKKDLLLFDKLNIPFECSTEQNYNIYKLTKINKNKVTCLESIKDILTHKKDILYFTSSFKETNLKIVYEKTTLSQIDKT